MLNRLTNAGYLDATDGWSGTSGLTLTADETVRGAAGRIVLRGTGTSSASGQARWLTPASTARADISADERIEVFANCAAFLAGVAVKPELQVVFYNSSGTALSTVALGLTAPPLALHGQAVQGLRETFWSAYAVLPRPANAVRASIEAGVTSTASSQTLEVCLLKPYIGPLSVRGRQAQWCPGSHANADLQRPNWPSDMALVGTAGGEPKPWALVHEAGAGLPAQRPIAAEPARKLAAQVRVDAVQRARLEAFAQTGQDFWIMEPESEKLCQGRFAADGAPKLSDARGGLHYLGVTLWLETA